MATTPRCYPLSIAPPSPPRVPSAPLIEVAQQPTIDLLERTRSPAPHRGPAAGVRPPIVGAQRPLWLAAAAAGGKLMMAVGASEVVRVARTSKMADRALAGILTGGGLAAAVFAALQFGQDVHALASPRRAWALKAISISAALTLSAASAVRQHLLTNDNLGLTWSPYCMGTLGFVLLCISLPDFFSFSEAHRGRSIIRHRLVIERALGGAGFATGFAWASYVSAQQRVPPVVGPVVLSCAATCVLVSFALFTSDARAAAAALRHELD